MAFVKKFWRSQEGVVESTLVIIPLMVLFLIAAQLILASTIEIWIWLTPKQMQPPAQLLRWYLATMKLSPFLPLIHLMRYVFSLLIAEGLFRALSRTCHF